MDVVSVGLRVRDDGTVQIQAFGEASEKAAKRIQQLEDQLNKLNGTQARGTSAGNGHTLATGKVSRALEGLITSTVGANHHLSQLSVAFSDMALGGVVVSGVLLGLGALAVAYDRLTKSAQDAMKAADDAITSLLKAARIRALNVNGAGGEQRAQIEDIGNGVDAFSSRQAFFGKLSNLTAGTFLQGIFGHIAQGYADQIVKAGEATKEAVSEFVEVVTKADEELAQKRKAAADKAQAARDKDAAEEVALQKSVADVKLRIVLDELKQVAYVQEVRNKVILDQIEDEKQAAEKRADQEKLVTENLVREMQDTWSQFFQNTLTEGLRSFRDLFSGIKQLFVKLISDLLAAGVMKRLAGVFGGIAMGSGGGGGQNGGLLNGLGMQIAGQGLAGGLAGGIVGYGVGHMVGGAGGGALAGGLAGAGAGFAVAGPIGALAGGLTGLIGGFLGGAAAAREAAAAMRQMKKDYDAAVLSFKHDDLGQALAQNAADAEALRQAARKLFFTIAQILKDQGQAYQDALADIAATEAKNNEIIKRQAVYAQEDLEVRNLRALGQGDAADRLAFQERQAREMQAALDSNKDALYINTLRTTQNNELLAFLNGTLQDAQRNSPSGFFASAYYSAYATPRGSPSDPFGTGMLPPNYPTEPPGTGAAGGSGLNPPGGSRNGPPDNRVTFDLSGSSFNFDGNRSGDEMVDDFLDALKRKANAVIGNNVPLSRAIDRMTA